MDGSVKFFKIKKIASLIPASTYVLQLCWPAIINTAKKHPKLFRWYLTAAFVAAVCIATAKAISTFPRKVFSFFSTEVRVSQWDTLHKALDKWFAENRPSVSGPRLWKGKSHNHMLNYNKLIFQSPGDVSSQSNFVFEADGPFYFWHGGRPFMCCFSQKRLKVEVDDDREKIISTIGFSKKPIERFFEHVWSAYSKDLANSTTTIWTPKGGFWSILATKRARYLDTVDLPDAVKKSLVRDIERYLDPKSEDRYRRRGVPYRRGYLFHGPPGTGETSLCMAIAAHFGLDLSVVSLTDHNITDSTLIDLFRRLPRPGILLFEDIDSAGVNREVESDAEDSPETSASVKKTQAKKMPGSKVTPSGLLNALDGPASPDGTIVIMTTNNPETLDSALTRPGRVDMKVVFHHADRELTLKLYRRFMNTTENPELEEHAEAFASSVPEGKFSPAEIQGFLLIHGHDIQAVLGNVETWVSDMLSHGESIPSRADDSKSIKTFKESKEVTSIESPAISLMPAETPAQPSPEVMGSSLEQPETSLTVTRGDASSSTDSFVDLGASA